MKFQINRSTVAVAAGLLGVALSSTVWSEITPTIGMTPVESIAIDQSSVRYIVKYKKTSSNTLMNTSGVSSFNSLEAKNTLMARGAEVKLELTSQHAIAAMLKHSDVIALRKDQNVISVELDAPRRLMAAYNDDAGDPTTTQLTPYSIYQSQANQLSLQPGIKVCIIDSGIAGSTGETGGLNNDFDWSNITGSNDSGTGNWNADGGPHGTHVAGTVGAADNGFGVVGMAPGVAMHIVKVFNAAGWGYSSDLAHAATQCTNAGANIITMSLGGGASNSTEENAFNTFTNNGGLVLAAAGNDGNTTRSYPAGYDSVMMIGGNNSDNGRYDASQYPSCNTAKTNCVEVTAGGLNVLSTYPSDGATVAGLSVGGAGYASAAMENTGNVSGSTYSMGTAESTDSGANGKICMIDRGNISFHDKVKNCEDSGGIGAVIVNNEAGVLQGTLGTSNTTTIPAVGAALEDRTAILAASTASISVGLGDYGLMSGTSMATPGVAGVAALVWSNHQECTSAQIREVLKTTAYDAGTAGHDVYYGDGIVKAKDASDYITSSGMCGAASNVNPVANFSSSCADLACTFDGSASSDSDGTVDSYDWDFGDGATASGANASHTYASAGTYSVKLTVTDNLGGTNLKSSLVTVTDPVPDNTPPTASFTDSCTELACSFDGSSSSDSDGTVASYAWSFGDGNAGTGSTASHNYAAAGTYSVQLTVTDNDGASNSTSSSVTVSETPTGDNVLANGVAKTGIADSSGGQVAYTMEVPAGATDLSFVITGGTGDADLYVRFGSAPTSSTYDCRPYKNGNEETCTITSVQAGTYHIMLAAYSTYSGVSLTGSYTEASEPGQGGSATVSDLSGSKRAWDHYTVEVPAGMGSLVVNMSGGTGDADLYVRQSGQPTTSQYDCRPYNSGNEETCSFTSPTAGTWYISVRGYSAYTGVNIVATWAE